MGLGYREHPRPISYYVSITLERGLGAEVGLGNNLRGAW